MYSVLIVIFDISILLLTLFSYAVCVESYMIRINKK